MPYLVSNQIAAATLDSIRISVQSFTSGLSTLQINLTEEQKKERASCRAAEKAMRVW